MKYESNDLAKSAQDSRRKDCKCSALRHLAAEGSAHVYNIIDRV